MFVSVVYVNRRLRLAKNLKEGIILLIGNNFVPVNYPDNTYPFRQDSTFLYYIGINLPSLVACFDTENGEVTLFGDDHPENMIIWTGKQPSLREQAKKSGINKVESLKKLPLFLQNQKRKIHYFLPYQADRLNILLTLLNKNYNEAKKNVSVELIRAVIDQRSVKEECEIEEIEKTLNNATYVMFKEALRCIESRRTEKEILGLITGISHQFGNGMAFQPIISIHGEILHNPNYNNILEKDKLLLIDAGAESMQHYATDITRTFPVNGFFSEKQKAIYEIVLNAQKEAINELKPGISFKQIHLLTCKIITNGLKTIGLLHGDTDEIIAKGAHAVFFPHGLGHMMGLDTHDMENLGEDEVGYDKEIKREEIFGISNLRLGRKMKENFVVTIEPGIYFIPELIKKWKREKKFPEHVNYKLAEEYYDFGGIRIEDDIVITSNSARVLGNNIPKEIRDIESFRL